MNVDLQNENAEQSKKIAKEITRSNIIINSFYDFVEDYLRLKKKDVNLSENKEVIKELEKIVQKVREINDKRIEAKENGANLVVNFKVKHTKLENEDNQDLPTDLGKLENLISISNYYQSAIEKWIFSLCLIANKKMTDEIYDCLYNYHVSKEESKIKNEWELEQFEAEKLTQNLTVKFSEKVKKPKSNINLNEYLKNLFNKPYEGLQGC